MTIKIAKISSIADPNAAVYVAYNLDHVQKICEMIGTRDTVWSVKQLRVIGEKAAKGELNYYDDGHTVTLTIPEPPKPVTTELTLREFHALTGALPWGTPIAFHGYDKGCGIHAYTTSDVWLFPKDGYPKLAVVLSSGPTYDGRASAREDSSDRESAGIFVVCEFMCQRPHVSVHTTEAAALKQAVQCAMDNLRDPDVPELEAMAEFESTLTEHDCIREGDYEVHILTPSN